MESPVFFHPLEKLSDELVFIHAGRYLPALTVPSVIKKMRQDSSHLIIPGESDALEAFLQKRRQQGLRININYIGEEVLGEQEALSRLDMYLKALEESGDRICFSKNFHDIFSDSTAGL